MKILILGHGKHGKDTVAELLAELYGFTFQSSSLAALEHAVWPTMRRRCGDQPDAPRYLTPEECFEDRANCRLEWRQLIADYNTPDPTRLARAILDVSDIYVGMRSNVEFQAARALFDRILWVHRPGFPLDESLDITLNPNTMLPVINAGDLDLLRSQLRKYFGEPDAVHVERAVGRSPESVQSEN